MTDETEEHRDDAQRDDQFEEAEKRLDQLHDALLEAYAAGFSKGVEFVDADPDFDTDVQTLKQKEPIQESHYYYWDGRGSEIELWLQNAREGEAELIADGGEVQATGDQHFNHIETDDIPEFVERGEREEDLKFGGGWDYYECPACGELICSFCDCPNEECRWYDADDWKKAIRETARERDDIYTGDAGGEGECLITTPASSGSITAPPLRRTFVGADRQLRPTFTAPVGRRRR